jgi:Carboxypeptidase regulatory-like domain
VLKFSGSRAGRRGIECFILMGLLVGLALAPAIAHAQQQRTVSGKVLGPSDEGKAGAVVYLKDVKTLSIRSAISIQDGSYRFGQLSDGTDYELWAELDGKKSATRSVSSFDQKKQNTINLKLK